MRYTVRLSYDGSSFCGWQIQRGAQSIQECLQNALSTLLKAGIEVTGAGRTDSGVNAVNYVAHFDWDGDAIIDPDNFVYKLNAILPRGIVVHEVLEAGPDFHARFDARRREYTYFLHRCKDPFIERYSYMYMRPLDVEAMNVAAGYILGTHDYSCFEKTGGNNKTSICTVFEAGWHYYTPSHVDVLGYPAGGKYLYFRISADRFLRNMVRAVVGTLLEVGVGKRSPESVKELVATGTRGDAGQSVPGEALFLNEVDY
ncbi:MAG: tRNA pseudouridine(38-40) synthase TruA [Bacteroidales bacterium]|nr:tRNA pseudouridine(38-40) synthase TruA [Bacteroidales bacterium]